MSAILVRNVPLPASLREAAPGAGPNRLCGYAAKFNVESDPLHDPGIREAFVEVIRPGAFKRTLREQPDIRALANHNTDHVLGRTKSGTLRLWEDAVGLAFECDLPETQPARDVKAMVARGDIDGCSFGFMVVEDLVELRSGLPSLRTLIDVELFEISPAVAFPAYSDSTVALRARTGQAGGIRPRLTLARARLLALDLG